MCVVFAVCFPEVTTRVKKKAFSGLTANCYKYPNAAIYGQIHTFISKDKKKKSSSGTQIWLSCRQGSDDVREEEEEDPVRQTLV